MFVRMLTAMAGDSFAYAHGETISLDDKVGKAWIKAGIAEAAPTAAASEKETQDLRAQLADAQAALHEAELDRDALREQIEALTAQNGDLAGKLAAATGA